MTKVRLLQIDHMKVFYSDHHKVSLPTGHNFPMDKYALLREALISQGVLCSRELYEAPIAPRDIVTLAHTIAYYDAVVCPGVLN